MMALLLDCETTGLIDNLVKRKERQPEIIEVYLCLANIESGVISDDFGSLIKPPKGIPNYITDITGISTAMVEDAPPFGLVAPRIRMMIESAPLCVGHNMTYDRDILDIEFSRMNIQLNWPKLLCTIEQTMYLKGGRMALSDLHEFLYGEKFTGAHRAKDDVHALLRCCQELLRRDLL